MKLFDRFRNAWKAFKKNDSRVGNLTFGIDIHKCSECDKVKEAKNVIYICDRKQCDNCSYPTCKHTADISHAENFIRINNIWVEKEE